MGIPHRTLSVARQAIRLVRRTVRKYLDDEMERMGAALAFYAVFSMVPVMVIALAIASTIFGRDAAAGRLQAELGTLFGHTAADFIRDAMVHATAPGQTPAAAVFGTLVFLLGASGAFVELQAAMNRVWGSTAAPAPGWVPYLERRMISFLMVVALGVMLVLSTGITTAVRAASTWVDKIVPISERTLHGLNLTTTFVLIAPMIAVLYKWLPDAPVQWRHVIVGSCLTSFLMGLGQVGIGLYLGHSPLVSAYGAAGSLVVVLVWVYGSAQLMLLGAEFTAVWSTDDGTEP